MDISIQFQMVHPFSLISVFTSPADDFRGNISAVVLFDKMRDEVSMQRLAADFNQPATTFLAPAGKENEFNVRWFAPDAEIGLCGHGSLAAVAYLTRQFPEAGEVTLYYEKGIVRGRKEGNGKSAILLDAIPVEEERPVFRILKEGLGIPVRKYFVTANKHIVLVESEDDLRQMEPDFAKLCESDVFGYAVTAPGNEVDFVSRTLVPHVKQLEDHATGSSHAVLVPFWSEKLNKRHMTAYQLSPRGGKFQCRIEGNKVNLSGTHCSIASGTCTV